MRVYFYALFIHLTLNIYVFYKGWNALKNKKILRTFFLSIFIAEIAIYLFGLFFSDILPENVFRFITLIGTSWMLFLFYMTLCWLMIDGLFYLHQRHKFMHPTVDTHPNITRGTAFIVSSVLITIVLVLGNDKFHHPVVEKFDIQIDKKLPKIKKMRAIVVGDTHFGFFIGKKMAQQYVDLIQKQKPDIIFLVGDIIDAEIAPILDQHIDEELSQLSAPLGVYACTGNHEYRYEAEQKIEWLQQKAHIDVLRDTAVFIDSSFYVIGREDDVFSHRNVLKNIFIENNIDKKFPIIVLNHSPTNLSEEADANVDLAFYGHTHEGQVFPFNLFTHLIFEVAHGYKRKGNTQLYVTSGLGLAGPQFRIGTQSEIAVFDITFN